SPAVSGSFMAAKMGLGATRTRMLDTALISGDRAKEVGLVQEVVERAEDVGPRAMEIAKELAAKSVGGVVATKKWLNEIEEGMQWIGAERALEASMSLTGGEEERLGVAAAIQRR